jgi:hypothetical protein
MPILGKITSALLCSTMLGGPIMAAPAGSPLDEGDPIGAESLLLNEIGFAIDATTYDSAGVPYVGAPCGGTVAIKWGDASDSPADAYGNVALDVSNLVQSGTSPKMVHFPDSPYVRWTPHNIIIQSQTFDNASWGKSQATVSANTTTAPDGTSTADTIIEASDVAQYHQISSTAATVISGEEYTGSIYVKAASGSRRLMLVVADTTLGAGGVYAGFDLAGAQVGFGPTTFGTWTSGAAPTITSVGNGWYRCTVTAITAHATLKLQIILDEGTGTAAVDHNYNGNGTSGLYIWGAQAVRGYNANPYLVTTTAARIGIPQGYDTAASKYGILVEPAATNVMLNSENWSAATWTSDNVAVSANDTVAPDGSTTADKITDNGNTGLHRIYQPVACTSGTTYTYSLYIKNGSIGSRYAYISVNNAFTNEPGIIVDVTNGTFLSYAAAGTPNSYSIISVGNGWYRISFTATASSTTDGYFIVGLAEGATDLSYTGNVENYYIWGAQLETGSIATSYIPTLGSTVTRARDNISALTSSIPYSTTKGTVYVDAKVKSSTTSVLCDFNDGADNDEWSVYVSSGTTWNAYSANNGTQYVGLTGTGVLDTRGQATFSNEANDADFSFDGGAVTSDGVSTYPAGITTLYIGTNFAGTMGPSLIYRIILVPRKVADGDLPTWRYNF